MSRHRCPRLRPIVTRAPACAHTGFFRTTLMVFLPSSFTTPTVAAALTLSISTSAILTGSTTSLSFAPTTLSSRCVSSLSSYLRGGSVPGSPAIEPTSLSLLTTLGSSEVMTAMLPPGTTSCDFWPPVISDTIFARRGFQIFWFFS